MIATPLARPQGLKLSSSPVPSRTWRWIKQRNTNSRDLVVRSNQQKGFGSDNASKEQQQAAKVSIAPMPRWCRHPHPHPHRPGSSPLLTFLHFHTTKQISKRGKVASRPSQQKQLERLQAEEQEYLNSLRQSTPTLPTSANEKVLAEIIEEEGDASVPEAITDRMLRRMLMFSIGPVFLGFTLFPLFYYMKKVQDIDLPIWAVYIVQTTIFAGGLLGITYGVISSSWDERREGSLLGWNEFQANLPLLLDRFKKKKDGY